MQSIGQRPRNEFGIAKGAGIFMIVRAFFESVFLNSQEHVVRHRSQSSEVTSSGNLSLRQEVKCLAVVVCAIFSLFMMSSEAFAELTTEHRREIASLKRTVSRVGSLLRRDRYEEAEETIDEVESRLEAIIEEAGISEDDRALASIQSEIERQKGLMDKSSGKAPKAKSEVSFIEDIAPIIDQKCLGCHGANNPRNGLRLDTFAGWRRGGQSGSLLIPGQPARSLLIARLSAPEGQGRMPARGEPLSKDEIMLVGQWIGQGAKLDFGSPQATLADLIYEHQKETLDVQIPKPTGTETVSFTQDMAPWMANLCLNCHNSRNKSGGLSVETFFDLMRGGDSGEVIIPGDMENSRFFRLVGGLELPRMPQGQGRITRQNYEDMKKWFAEGNTFDGADPRTNIRTYVRSEAEMLAEQFRSKTDEEMIAHRLERTTEQLRRSVPNDPRESVDTEHFLVVGNVSKDRLEEVAEDAEEHLSELHKMFGGEGLPWRGKLAIFVLKDRFSYDEFNQVVEMRRADQEMSGHSKVTASHEEAYIAFQDRGDDASDTPTTEQLLIEHLTGAYLKQSGTALPDWVVSGTGLMMSMKGVRTGPQVLQMKQTAASLVPTLGKPEDVFEDGSFSPATIGPVGFTLVQYLLDQGGPGKFARLIQGFRNGLNADRAFRDAYGADATQIARGYLASLRG
ncbi:c-type cytochrome domain-containing protein [Thalassoglobus sp. JC818]|uniref:c-type cytochrome domain-containing protein n=1 Tax=Thalassoglobus sp. JC818 TaxID=3232136 RepID=UPI003459A7BA